MAIIITESNCVRIDDVLIPKNSFKVLKLGTMVRLVYAIGHKDIEFSTTTIDGEPVTNSDELFDWFKSNAFKNGGGDGGTGVTGTERQVSGFDSSGAQAAVRLGWKQLSDLPSPPPFLNGVLIGTAFKPNGDALFGFLEMALDGPESFIKPNAFPVYNPGTIGNGGGTLPVADAVKDIDAVSFSQLKALMARVSALEGV